jgi:Resolvase, N terminal domain
MGGWSMIIGYARVSTTEQNLDLQRDALNRPGCETIIEDTVSGGKVQRPGLERVYDTLRSGDVLAVWRLDRLGRSLKHLIELMAELEAVRIGLQSVTESIDTRNRQCGRRLKADALQICRGGWQQMTSDREDVVRGVLSPPDTVYVQVFFGRSGRAIPPSTCRNAGLSAPFHPFSLQFGRVATILTFVDCQSGKSATFGVRSTREEVPGLPW